MQATTVYLSEELRQKINLLSQASGVPKARIIRDALEKSIQTTTPATSGAKVLLKLSQLSGKGPRDLAQNHDKYAWD